jgi:uncharacterized membrane protein YdjX (TVP38/TMEM64 family)
MNWKNIRHWAHGLVAATISSISTAVLSTIGTNITGDPLNWHQVVTIMVSGGMIGAFAYLKQSPLPAESETKE